MFPGLVLGALILFLKQIIEPIEKSTSLNPLVTKEGRNCLKRAMW
tara:strand:+ start:7240 stop:7374 length:135 start_codon:yes stop_codon:yes gene_type:complete